MKHIILILLSFILMILLLAVLFKGWKVIIGFIFGIIWTVIILFYILMIYLRSQGKL